MDLINNKQILIVINDCMDELMGHIERLAPNNDTILHINHLKFLQGYYAGSLSLIQDQIKEQEAKKCQHGQPAF